MAEFGFEILLYGSLKYRCLMLFDLWEYIFIYSILYDEGVIVL